MIVASYCDWLRRMLFQDMISSLLYTQADLATKTCLVVLLLLLNAYQSSIFIIQLIFQAMPLEAVCAAAGTTLVVIGYLMEGSIVACGEQICRQQYYLEVGHREIHLTEARFGAYIRSAAAVAREQQYRISRINKCLPPHGARYSQLLLLQL